MSNSRLEKFIYAICSMDVSDLPVPLSRIEKLWNCLITGETPDFEPLSRNEKYLMAMLDRYDISNLPAPMSRGEKLLYKIAVGETDLSDVPGYLSRYEELLKYLIENGGISGGDFEYILYTLNQSMHTLYTTAEKPVKSAILRGLTLANLIYHTQNMAFLYSSAEAKEVYTINDISPRKLNITVNTQPTYWYYIPVKINIDLLKPNTKYLIKAKNLNNIVSAQICEGSGNNKLAVQKPFMDNSYAIITTNDLSTLNGKEILYIAITDFKKNTIEYPTTISVEDIMLIEYQEGMENWDIPYFEGMQSVKMPVLTTSNEDGTKTNILTTPEDVELRRIGDVKDTLDCLTGEVTESIGEIVLDGTQYMDADGRGIYIQVDDMKKVEDYRAIITCDKLPVFYQQWDLPSVENGISGYRDEENKYPGQNWLYIKVNNSIDVDEVRQMLIQNPITVQYALVEESIKTVDLTVVDQDNQPTQLGTFENVTHVSLEAENLIPEVEMEVATNLLEDTVFNLTNAFNTLYPTAAKPVKSAILKGQTLVNYFNPNTISELPDEGFLLNEPDFSRQRVFNYIPLQPYEDNTEYTMIVWLKDVVNPNNAALLISFGSADLLINNFKNGINIAKGTIKTISGNPNIRIGNVDVLNGAGATLIGAVILKGDYTTILLNSPFYGMQSVKMPVLTTTGKNLFDGDFYFRQKYDINIKTIVDADNRTSSSTVINVRPNTEYYIKSFNQLNGKLRFKGVMFYDANGDYLSETLAYAYAGSFVTPSNCHYITFEVQTSDWSEYTLDELKSQNYQIEEGSVATSYEPYKSNILTVNEEVELRGIGDVQDTLNCLTGEVAERIGEIVLNGSENISFVKRNETTSTISFTIQHYQAKHTDNYRLANALCDVLIQKEQSPSWNLQEEYFCINANGEITISLLKIKLTPIDVAGLKKYLQQNPITIQYELATESIKTVDLTVVDQDGNSTTLETFDDTTHVLLNSEGLIPTAALTVRTKIPSASSTSLLMNDISTKQERLNTTIDEQSENVDATMIATTEIFEETL